MENQTEVIGIDSFGAKDRNVSPSYTCDYNVPDETIACQMSEPRYALMLLNKKCLNLA